MCVIYLVDLSSFSIYHLCLGDEILKKTLNIENIGFGGLQWFYWAANCTLFPFLVPYLKSSGYDEISIGTLISLMSLASIIGQPFWGNFIDRRSSTRNIFRNVLIACLIVSGFIGIFIPYLIGFFVILTLIIMLMSFTESSMYTIIDSWTLNCTPTKPWIDYGLTRGLGSLGYSITAIFFGIVLDRFGYNKMFPAHFAMILFAITFCFIVGRSNKASCSSPKTVGRKISFPFLDIGKSPQFIWFLSSSTIIYIGYRALQTFYPILLSQKGGDNKALGISLFIMAASEVPVLFLSKRLLNKYKDTSLITVSMFFFLIRIFLHAVIPSVEGLVLLQATQSLSFGLFLPASVHYVNRLAPIGLSSTFLTIASSCYFGIGGILGSFIGGILVDKAGIYFMLWCSAILSLIGLLIFIFSPKASKTKSIGVT